MCWNQTILKDVLKSIFGTLFHWSKVKKPTADEKNCANYITSHPLPTLPRVAECVKSFSQGCLTFHHRVSCPLWKGYSYTLKSFFRVGCHTFDHWVSWLLYKGYKLILRANMAFTHPWEWFSIPKIKFYQRVGCGKAATYVKSVFNTVLRIISKFFLFPIQTFLRNHWKTKSNIFLRKYLQAYLVSLV